jgi:hypothetical protein
MSFVPFEGELQFNDRSHLWCEMEDGSIEIAEDDGGGIHADYFGQWAWDTGKRGYIYDDMGVVTCHVSMTPGLERKLAREMPDVMYKADPSNTKWA